MIESRHVDVGTKDAFRSIWNFKYAPGGSLDVFISVSETTVTRNPNNTLQYLVTTERQLNMLRDKKLEDVCRHEPFNFSDAEVVAPVGAKYNLTAEISLIADHEDRFYILQLNCQRQRFTVLLEIAAINPGGEFLSLSDVPYKQMFFVVSLVWAALLVLWSYNWFQYRKFNVRLQRFMTLAPLTQIASAVVSYFYWVELSETGIDPEYLHWASLLVEGASRGIFFACLVYVAKGWSITRAGLKGNEIRFIWGMILLLTVSYWVYKYFSGFVLFFLVIMYVFVLRYIFAAIVENSQALVVQLQLIRRMDIDASSTPVYTKFHMFKMFQGAMVVYISVIVIFHLWATIFLQKTRWIEEMMEQTINILMAIGVGYTFRLRPFNPYFYVIPPLNDGSSANDLDAPVSSINEIQPGGHPWKPGMPLPQLPNDYSALLRGPQQPLLIVENPPTYDSDGNVVENVSVAEPVPPSRRPNQSLAKDGKLTNFSSE